MKPVRLFSIVGAVLVGLLIIGAVILTSIDVNQYKPQITQLVHSATGRKLAIDGDLRLGISRGLTLSVDGARIGNADWGSRPDMVSVKRLVARVQLIPLLFGDVRIEQLILEQPHVLLETNSKGIGNWVFDAGQPQDLETQTGSTSLPMINSVRMDGALITYRDGRTGKSDTFAIETLQADAADLASPLNLLVKGSLDDTPLEVTGTLDNVRALISTGDIRLDVGLTTDAGTATLKADGSVSEGGRLLHVHRLEVRAGKSSVDGKLSLDLRRQPPLLKGDFKSDLLELSGRKSTAAARAPNGSPGKLFPDDPLPLEGMRSIGLDLAFEGKRIIGPRYAFEDVELRATLEKGVLQIAPISMLIGGGATTASIAVDGSRDVGSLNLQISAREIDLGRTLAETGQADFVSDAPMRVEIALKGRGRSIASLVGNLSGRVLLQVGRGKINNSHLNLAGADLISQLVGALNPLAKHEALTNLDCAVVNLQFSKGIAKYERRIAVETDKMTITSSGEINLAQQTLDIGMKPQPRKDSLDLGIGAGDLVDAVRLHGPLTDLELGLDTLGTAKAGLKVYGAIATGGASLLVGGLLDKAMADPSPCQTALGKTSTGNQNGAESSRADTQPTDKAGSFFNQLKQKLGQ